MTHAMTPPAAAPASPFGASANSRLTPVDPIRLIRQYKFTFILALFVGVGMGIGVFILLKKLAPKYTATAAISVRAEMTNAYSLASERIAAGDTLEILKQTQALFLQDEDILRKALQSNSVKETDWFIPRRDDLDKAYRDLKEILTVRALPDTVLIQVSVSAPDARSAEILANAITDTYIERNRLDSRMSRDKVEQMFSRRRGKLEEDRTILEAQAKSIMDLTEFTATDQTSKEIETQFNWLITQRDQIVQELLAAQRQYQTLLKSIEEQTVEYSPEDLLIVESDPIIRNIDARILGLREQRRVALERFGKDHRSVTDMDYRIQAAQTERKTEYQRLLAQQQEVKVDRAAGAVALLQSSLADLDNRLADIRQRRQEIGHKLQTYASVQKEIERTDLAVQRLDEMLTSMDIVRQHPDAVQVAISSPATTPKDLSFPKAKAVVPGVTFMVLALVGSIVFLKELLDNRIKGPSCTRLLPSAELLGVIPEAQDDPSRPKSIERVVVRDPSGLLAENFRQLRTAVIDKMQRRRYKTLMVAGCQPRGGTSNIVANLAASAAFNDRRTLIIDANHRQPSQHRLFDLAKAPGLADVLISNAQVEEVIQQTLVQGLDLLAIGQADGHLLERIESDQFTRMLRQLEERYDLIIVDAPPLSVVGDSRVLANRVDAVLLNVRAMNERRGLVSRVINQLSDCRCEFLGIVLNGVRSSAGGYFRRNFEAFYEYQNGDSKSGKTGRRKPARSGQAV